MPLKTRDETYVIQPILWDFGHIAMDDQRFVKFSRRTLPDVDVRQSQENRQAAEDLARQARHLWVTQLKIRVRRDRDAQLHTHLQQLAENVDA